MKLTTRMVSVRGKGPQTLNEENRSVEFAAATEIPARVWDLDRGIVDEILIMGGVALPGNKQVPFLDSHNRNTVDDVLGSMRDFRAEGGELVGRAYFSKRQKAQDAFSDVREGHITDVSVGYEVTEATWVPDGEKAVIGGREYSGPVKVSTRWNLREVSLTPIGADAAAKVRSEPAPVAGKIDPEPTPPKESNPPIPARGEPSNKGEIPMKFNEWLVRAGFDPKTLTEQQMASLRAQFDAEVKKAEDEAKASKTPAPDLSAAERAGMVKEQTRVSEIMEACRTVGQDAMAADLIKNGSTVEQAIRAIHAKVAETMKPIPAAPRIEGGATDNEKFSRAAVDAMLISAIGPNAVKTPAPGAAEMRGATFSELARECLRRAGIFTAMMGKETILRLALKHGRSQRSSAETPTTNTAGLTYLLADAANKAMMVGWNGAATTYQEWCSIGSIPDFRAARRVQISDAPNLLAVAEGAPVTHGKMTDSGESITLVTYARKLVVTRQALVNDDLGVLATIFAMFGRRAANLVNALPYAVLAANAALVDAGALFNANAVAYNAAGLSAGHANLAGAAAAISATTLTTGTAAMFAQTAPGGSVLNLRPRFLLTGGNYMVAAQIETGLIVPTASTPSGLKNPFNIITPLADANIAGNGWFLAADPMECPTVEVAFLNGQRTPTLTEEPTSPVLGVDFTALIDATAKALDFRGLYSVPAA